MLMKPIQYEVLQEVIKLGEDRAKLETQLDNHFEIISLQDLPDLNKSDSSLEREIELLSKRITSTFRALNLDEILEIQAIMYLGLYQIYNHEASTDRILKEQLKETGHGTDPEVEIKQIVDKDMFHKYLLDGCKILHIAL